MDARTTFYVVSLAIVGGVIGALVGTIAIEGLEELAHDNHAWIDENGAVQVRNDGWSEQTLTLVQIAAMVLLIGGSLAVAGRAAWRHSPRPLAFFVALAAAMPVGLWLM